MAGQNLHVTHGPACVMYEPRCSGDEGPAARMGRTSRQPYDLVSPGDRFRLSQGTWFDPSGVGR